MRETLIDTLSFQRNRVHYSLFYTASGATIIMFIVLCSLSGWSVSIGHQISDVVATGQETLKDVQELLPELDQALAMLSAMCNHDNFTRSYGHICNK